MLSSSLLFFSPPVCMMLISCLSVSSCSFVSSFLASPPAFCLWVFGGFFFFFFLAFLYKDSFNVVCSSFVNQLKNVFFFNKKACLWCVERVGNAEKMDITSYAEPNKGFQLHRCAPIHVNQCIRLTLNSQVYSVMTRSVCHYYAEMWRAKRHRDSPNIF